VEPDAFVSAQPVSETVCTDGVAVLSVTVSGGSYLLSYQWESASLSTGPWAIIGGATDETYTAVTTTTGITYYRVQITDTSDGCTNLTTDVVFVDVLNDATVSASADNNPVCIGGNVTISSSVTFGSGTFAYQWQDSLAGGNWNDIAGATASTFAPSTTQSGTTYYRVAVTDNVSGCADPVSAPVEIIVAEDPAISAQPQDSVICAGENVDLEITATGGASPLMYQWQDSVSGGGWADITGATLATYNTGALIQTTYYRVLVSAAAVGCDPVVSAVAEIGVIDLPQATVTVVDETCDLINGSITFVFPNHPTMTALAFSLDGGVNYQADVPDNVGSVTYSDLDAGAYDLWVRWSDETCPVDLGQVVIGDIKCGSICGEVRDDTGAGIEGVTVRLYNDGNGDGELTGTELNVIVDTILTAADGSYCFTEIIVGDYVLVEVQPALYLDVDDFDRTTGAFDPDGNDSLQLADNDIPVTLVAYEADEDNDFVENPFNGTISGFVFNDLGNPMSAVTNRLYADTNFDGNKDGAPLVSTTTNASGFYQFNNVEPGYYVVFEVHPLGYGNVSDYDESITASDLDGDDSASGPDDDVPVILLPGEDDLDNNFRNSRPGTICGKVIDGGGNPIGGVTIRLYGDANGNGHVDGNEGLTILAQTLTSADGGNYCFSDVPEGDYVIVEVQPPNYSSIDDFDRSTGPFDPDGNDSLELADNDIPVTLLPAEEDMNNDFVENLLVGAISGYVFDDLMIPMGGVTIVLYDDANADGIRDTTIVATTVTDGSGLFVFDSIAPAHYVLFEIQPLYYGNISDYDISTGGFDPDGDDSGQGPDDDIPVNLAPSESDQGNNFVNSRPGTICGRVHDESDYGISGVTLELYADPNGDGSSNGPALATQVTDANGVYCFVNLTPGNYVVEEIQPALYTDLFDYDFTTGAFDPDGNDSLQGPDNDIPATVAPGEQDEDNDFVEDASSGIISGYVLNDILVPMQGVTLRLYADADTNGVKNGGILMSATTNASGYYEFVDVEHGSYIVEEVQNLAYGSVSDYDTTAEDLYMSVLIDDDSALGPNNQIRVLMAVNESDEDNIFIDSRPGTICGMVRDEFFSPIGGVTIHLYADSNGDGDEDGPILATTLTSADGGTYCFSDVPAGDSVVVEVQPPLYDNLYDYDFSTGAFDPDGVDTIPNVWDNDIPVTLEPAETDLNNDFVEDANSGNITGYVYNDIGVPMAGITIRLFTDVDTNNVKDGAFIASAVTNAMGFYQFSSVEYGSYIVEEVQNLIYGSISDYDTTAEDFFNAQFIDDDSALGPNDQIRVLMAVGETDADNNFQNSRPGSICGQVRDERNYSIGGVTIKLYADTNSDGNADGSALLTTMTSADGGNYCFNDIPPGDYVVVETQPPLYDDLYDYDFTTGAFDPDGVDTIPTLADNDIPVTVAPAEADNNNDFVEDANSGIISGYVLDEVGNPMVGVSLNLYEDLDTLGIKGAFVATVVTNVTGFYQFFGIEHESYIIEEVQTPGYGNVSDYDTTAEDLHNAVLIDDDSALGPNNEIRVIVGIGETDADNIFVNSRPGQICGRVHDEFDYGIAGVTIDLYGDANGDGDEDGPVLATMVTSGTGNYCFTNVVPGNYVVVETQPASYGNLYDYDFSTGAFDPDGVDTIPNNWDNDIPVTLAPNESDDDNDFVEDANEGSITGYVLDDINTPMQGVTIRLYADVDTNGVKAGGILASAVTNAFGFYQITGVEHGSYIVEEVQNIVYGSISDYDTTAEDFYNAEFIDDDSALGPNNQIRVLMSVGETDADNNFQNSRPGQICGQVRDERDYPIGGVTIKLYADTNGDGNADGSALITVMTSADGGTFCISDVPPGDYVLVETQPPLYDNLYDYDFTTGAFDPDGVDTIPNPWDNDIPVTVVPAEADLNNDFIEDANSGIISGYVTDEVDSALAGITLRLYADVDTNGVEDGPEIANTTTNASGFYQFFNVEHGAYVVKEDQPVPYGSESDYDNTPEDTNDDDFFLGPNDRIPVTVLVGETDSENNFVDTRPGSICGSVMDDLGNALVNIEVQLFSDTDGDGVGDIYLYSEYTDVMGDYCFTDVTPGVYVVVQIETPAHMLEYGELDDYDHSTGPFDPDGDDTAEGQDNDIPVIVGPNEIDSSNIFTDIACPGIPEIIGTPPYVVCDGGEVTFTAVAQMLGTVTYTWNFGPGATPATATGIGPHVVTYAWSASNQTNGAAVSLTIEKAGCIAQNDSVATVFVNPYPSVAISGSTSNLCVSGNGVNITRTFQPQAAEIPGATYTWDFGSNATPATATGYGPHVVYYTSTGSKLVQMAVDPNYAIQSCPDTGSISFNVVQCVGNIAGTVVTDDVPPQGFQGVQIALHKDVNADGIPDAGAAVATATTQASGAYSFGGIATGHYIIKQNLQPAGYISLSDLDISADGDVVPNTNLTDDLIPCTLTPGKNDLGNNFVETAQAGSVSGSVFEDFDGDQQLDPGEGIAGVIVNLFVDADEDGVADGPTPLLTVITAADGTYAFVPVDNGTYVIVEEQPVEYNNVIDIGSTGTGDLNDLPNTNQTDDIIPVEVAPGEADGNNRFIEELACPRLVVNTNSSGPGSLRYNIDCAVDGDTIRFSPDLAGDTIVLSSIITIDKNLVILSEITPVIYIMSETSGEFVINAGKVVEFNNLNVISGSPDAPAAFDVLGELILDDVQVFRNTNLTPGSILVESTGTVTIRGQTEIHN